LGNPGLNKQAGPDAFASKGELVYFYQLADKTANVFLRLEKMG